MRSSFHTTMLESNEDDGFSLLWGALQSVAAYAHFTRFHVIERE